MPSGGSRPQHQERSFVRRIERGFDFFGYHDRPGQLSVAEKTIEQFIERAIRLYEQEPGEVLASARLGPHLQTADRKGTERPREGGGQKPPHR